MRHLPRIVALICVAAVVIGVVSLRPSSGEAIVVHSITAHDTAALGYSSLVLDTAGNPVVAYQGHEPGFGYDLKLLRCNDPNCDGGGESITGPLADTFRFAGAWPSLKLDSSGYPVVSYFVGAPSVGGALFVMHCNDPLCRGNDEADKVLGVGSITFGQFTSLALDASGNPVVSYYGSNGSVGELHLLHCGDPTCSAGNSTTVPDSGGNVGRYTSLALDASGNPIVSYIDSATDELKVLHCNDPLCEGAGDVIAVPDSGSGNTSLVLDAAGNPVVSYVASGDLKVLHCGDPYCSAGNSVQTVDVTTAIDESIGSTSLALNALGRPIVAYHRLSGLPFYPSTQVQVLSCGNVNCSAGNSVEIVGGSGPDLASTLSMVLDSAGNPVVSYPNSIRQQLQILHCAFPSCSKTPPSVGGVAIDGEQAPLSALEAGEQRTRDLRFWIAGALIGLVGVVVASAFVTGRLRSRS